MRKTAASLLLLLAPLALRAQSSAGEFSGTAVVDTSQGTRTFPLYLVVTNPMTMDETAPLKAILEKGGQQALLAAIRGSNRGRFRLGQLEYSVDLVVVEPVRDGLRYSIVTAREIRYEEIQEGKPSLQHPFSVAVFDVPEFGLGEGRIFTKASLFVDADGHPHAEQYENRRGVLKEIKRVK